MKKEGETPVLRRPWMVLFLLSAVSSLIVMNQTVLPSLLNLKENPRSADSVRKVVREFESLFLESLLKTMRKGFSVRSNLGEGASGSIKEEIVYSEVARFLSDAGGIGLADMICEALSSEEGSGKNELSLGGAALHPWIAKRYASAPRRGIADRPFGDVSFDAPCAGRLTSGFGWRKDPFTGRRMFHGGIDIAARRGTPIEAAAGGTVVFSGWRRGYGRIVVIDHGDGLKTRYAHNSRNLVAKGDSVGKGQKIALVGKSGRTTGPHVHFEVERKGEKIDPSLFLRRGKRN